MKTTLVTTPAAMGAVGGRVRVVNLTLPLRLAIPSLLISSMPKQAIGFSYEKGTAGALTGAVLLGGSILVGAILFHPIGLVALVAMIWLIGSAGMVMLCSFATGLAFVKPLCTGCRLLPIIKEHETMHINGMKSDLMIWDAVRGKYSFEGLSLGTDPAICSFCPIAKRLKHS